MGIVEETLASFTVDGTPWTIEWNEGDYVHIHMGKMRFVLPLDKYQAFAKLVLDARRNLREMKGLAPTPAPAPAPAKRA